MSSAYNTFGEGPEGYDDDAEGVQHEARELADEQAERPEMYEGPMIWTCDHCGAEGTEDVMDLHICPDDDTSEPLGAL